jgi:hypothetical protein
LRLPAAPHQPPDRSDHLFGPLLLLRRLCADHAGVGVAVEQPERDLVADGATGQPARTVAADRV